ncbi:MAG TPA: GNAT family N-acetyltransferase [Usitatibacter sp.]|nr:GNAT family N-acetyltransferase [Usitatibacter sp.]
MTLTVRPIEPRDEPRWRELWDGYNRFYGREPAEPQTRHTWSRIMDPAAPIHALVAEVDDAFLPPGGGPGRGSIVGIANYVIHESTLTLTPVCYLQDLYVDPEVRGSGIGKALIDWLVAEMKARNWSRLYWGTRETNYRARGLYDKYTPHSGFLRYVLYNEEKWK